MIISEKTKQRAVLQMLLPNQILSFQDQFFTPLQIRKYIQLFSLVQLAVSCPFYLFHSYLEGRLNPQTRLHFESQFFFEHAIVIIQWSIEIPGSRPPGVCGDYASSALLMT